jgi:hypothetical protein
MVRLTSSPLRCPSVSSLSSDGCVGWHGVVWRLSLCRGLEGQMWAIIAKHRLVGRQYDWFYMHALFGRGFLAPQRNASWGHDW